MGQRIKLGLIFSFNEQWIGGTYYILNLISALGTLPNHLQPQITILSKNKEDFITAQKTGYQFLSYHNPFNYKRNWVEAFINGLGKKIFKKNIIDKRVSTKKIDALFPATNEICFARIINKIFWFPDFQHLYYPDFFSVEEISSRNLFIEQITSSSQKLILSSESALNHWKSIELNKDCAVSVIPFAVTHPSLNELLINEILDEFTIPNGYFIVSNQFWKHKNHFVVLKAAYYLKQRNITCCFLFTGKEDDYRNPGYFETIVSFINENNLQENIKLLGLIDRKKQLKLMQHSLAVIQPSLFEGWSTVIEDAKALGKQVIASNIPVHYEQLGSNGIYFEPKNEISLVEAIKTILLGDAEMDTFDYKRNILDFGKKFYDVLESSINKR